MKIPKFKMWYLSNRVDVKYDITSWALPVRVMHSMNFYQGLRETIIGFLCFEVRIMQRRNRL